MALMQLRTYTLKSAQLAQTYAARWKPTMQSITAHNITTRGVFLSDTNPKQVIALVEFPADVKDQDAANARIGEYAASEAFKKDMGDEIDMGCFEAVEANFVRATEFSPQ